MKWTDLGYRRIYCMTPKIELGNPIQNAKNHIDLLKKTDEPFICLFPELSITGYTCEDLFFNEDLKKNIAPAIKLIIDYSVNMPNAIIVIGSPFELDNRLYNSAFIISNGQLHGIVPKIFLPNYGEFYEMRWFSSGRGVNSNIKFNDCIIPFGENLIFNINDVRIGIEICEDLWAVNPPSNQLAINGAEIILNLSASNEVVSKHVYRKELVKQQSARLNAIYCYSGAGNWESSKDLIFSGAKLIAENGDLLLDQKEYDLLENLAFSDVDINKIKNERIRNKTYSQESTTMTKNIIISNNYTLNNLSRTYNHLPFLTKDTERYDEILEMQSCALARRFISSKSEKLILGLSGGLDSTLALIVCVKAMEKLKKSNKDIIAVSMPAHGTSKRTKKQSNDLAKYLDITFYEINIKRSIDMHLRDIQHDTMDVTFENAQARERTQILFDMGNKHKGIVVGTGDLSEIALGFSTYNGDSSSSYNVNGSIPKTLVKELVKHYANNQLIKNNKLSKSFYDVLETKISPELLPPDKNGNISQSTEDILGKYEYHDFFLYHFIRNNFSREKILKIALISFKNTKYEIEEKEMNKYLSIFYSKFFKNQFKRTFTPAGIKVGSVSLSPRGDFRMPDEAKEL